MLVVARAPNRQKTSHVAIIVYMRVRSPCAASVMVLLLPSVAATPEDGNVSAPADCWWREAHDCCDRTGTELLPPSEVERAYNEFVREVGGAGKDSLSRTMPPQLLRYLEKVHSHKNAGAASLHEMYALAAAMLWVARWHGPSIRSVETGFAQGHSALAIVAAAHGGGHAINHTAIDPYQFSRWGGNGREVMAAFDQKWPDPRRHFRHLATPAAAGLAAMQSGGACVQLAFMDDGHKFDDNVVELHMLGLMMPVLGVLVIDDTPMPSVAAVGSFIERNLPFRRAVVNERFVAYVKVGRDTRKWDHYVPFKGDFKRAHPTKGRGMQFMKNVSGSWAQT